MKVSVSANIEQLLALYLLVLLTALHFVEQPLLQVMTRPAL